MSRRYLLAGAGALAFGALTLVLATQHGPMYLPALAPLLATVVCAELIRRWADDI